MLHGIYDCKCITRILYRNIEIYFTSSIKKFNVVDTSTCSHVKKNIPDVKKNTHCKCILYTRKFYGKKINFVSCLKINILYEIILLKELDSSFLYRAKKCIYVTQTWHFRHLFKINKLTKVQIQILISSDTMKLVTMSRMEWYKTFKHTLVRTLAHQSVSKHY